MYKKVFNSILQLSAADDKNLQKSTVRLGSIPCSLLFVLNRFQAEQSQRRYYDGWQCGREQNVACSRHTAQIDGEALK